MSSQPLINHFDQLPIYSQSDHEHMKQTDWKSSVSPEAVYRSDGIHRKVTYIWEVNGCTRAAALIALPFLILSCCCCRSERISALIIEAGWLGITKKEGLKRDDAATNQFLFRELKKLGVIDSSSILKCREYINAHSNSVKYHAGYAYIPLILPTYGTSIFLFSAEGDFSKGVRMEVHMDNKSGKPLSMVDLELAAQFFCEQFERSLESRGRTSA